MHKQVLTMGVAISLLMSLGTGYSVNARALRQTAVDRYYYSTETFVTGTVDAKGNGTITVSHDDDKLGTISSTLNVTANTKYLRKHGGDMTFQEIRPGDKLSITLLRNPDGSQSPMTITDHNTWFLENAVTKAEVTSVTPTMISAVEDKTKETVSVPVTAQTVIVKPNGVAGTTADIQLGRNIRARGFMRLIDETPIIEQTLVIWIIPENGE